MSDLREKAQIFAHGKRISKIFDLLGEEENALTGAVGWMLHESPAFLDRVVAEIFGRSLPSSQRIIRLQSYESSHGYTDIEIDQPGIGCAILEAKRGWHLPTRRQLSKYAERKSFRSASQRRLVVLNECLPEYVRTHLEVDPSLRRMVAPLRWQWILSAAEKVAARRGTIEKGLLRQMAAWLREHVTMRTLDNWVYVLALSSLKPANWKVSWIDIVEKKRRYFHPVGVRGWPSQPPTYIGFRYHGRLQSIHFVESHEVIHNLHDGVSEIPRSEKRKEPHFLYHLGPPIRPTHLVKSAGLYRNARHWCMLDTLLTCKSILQARRLSEVREKRGKEDQ